MRAIRKNKKAETVEYFMKDGTMYTMTYKQLRYFFSNKYDKDKFEEITTRPDEITLIGTTTLRRMRCIDNNMKNSERLVYSEIKVNCSNLEVVKGNANDKVYLYYHKDLDMTIMSTEKDDYYGIFASSIGIDGKFIDSILVA